MYVYIYIYIYIYTHIHTTPSPMASARGCSRRRGTPARRGSWRPLSATARRLRLRLRPPPSAPAQPPCPSPTSASPPPAARPASSMSEMMSAIDSGSTCVLRRTTVCLAGLPERGGSAQRSCSCLSAQQSALDG